MAEHWAQTNQWRMVIIPGLALPARLCNVTAGPASIIHLKLSVCKLEISEPWHLQSTPPPALSATLPPWSFMMWRMWRNYWLSPPQSPHRPELRSLISSVYITRITTSRCWSLAPRVRQELTSKTIYHWNKRRSLNSLNSPKPFSTNRNIQPASHSIRSIPLE